MSEWYMEMARRRQRIVKHWIKFLVGVGLVVLALVLVAGCATTKAPKDDVVMIEINPPAQSGPQVFVTNSSHEWMIAMSKIADCVVKLPEVKAEIATFESFEWTEDSGGQVAAKIGSKQSEVKEYTTNRAVSIFRRVWPGFGTVNAYTTKASTDIYYNTRAVARSLKDKVGTICHEHAHVLGYDHGGNGSHTTGVPAALGDICMKHIGRCL